LGGIKMKRFLAVLLLVSVIAMLFVGCSKTITPDKIKKRGELIVATNAEFPPFEYFEGDNIVGIDMDIAQAIADELGVELKIDHMNFDAVLAAVPSGKADLGIAALSTSPERLKVMDFSDTYFTCSVVALVGIDNDTIKGQDDLVGKRIGVQTGTIADTIATDIEGAEVVRMNKDADSVQDLINGKLDAVLIDENPGKIFVSQNSDKIKMLDEQLSDDEYAIATKKGNTELIKVVNEVIKELKDSGEYDKILEKYLGPQ
jgi:ABC-type amino acid transport substrate-binding protein